MRRHHQRRLDPVVTEGTQRLLGLETPHYDRCHAGQQGAHPAQWPRVVHRPEDEVSPEFGVPAPSQGLEVFPHR